MPGVLVDDSSAADTLPTLPHSSPPSLLSPLRHYIPVLTRSILPEFCGDELPPSQLSSLCRRPAGVCLNVNSLPDMYAEDGNLLEPGLLLQLSPASTAQRGCNGASPTTLSALSGLQQFLPSNFEGDEGGIESQTDMYSCDQFRMYEFKVRRCMRGRSHDWTECPFAHPGEKARRRDPRIFHYSGTACADFRKGSCKKGDACEYAHGVFECWLHPARYRTQPCKDGQGCRRRICFFAHTLDQLRIVSPSRSALSSPTSLHFSPMEVDAFELCGSPSPIRSPAKKASYESSPLCHMAMEASSDGFSALNFSLTPSVAPSPPVSPSLSARSVHINWSPRGVSTFTLPIPAKPHLYSSFHLNRAQASPSTMPAHYRHLESLNQCAIPDSTLQSPTSATACTTTSTMQQIQDLMGLLKQADLSKEMLGQATSFFEGGNTTMLWQGGAGSVPEMPIKVGYSRAREEEMLFGDYCNEEEEGGEPKLERVESGKGLRAQIFESLLRSASQSSECTYQDSNTEPLWSSSSLGF